MVGAGSRWSRSRFATITRGSELQGQNLALTILSVSNSLDMSGGCRFSMEQESIRDYNEWVLETRGVQSRRSLALLSPSLCLFMSLCLSVCLSLSLSRARALSLSFSRTLSRSFIFLSLSISLYKGTFSLSLQNDALSLQVDYNE